MPRGKIRQSQMRYAMDVYFMVIRDLLHVPMLLGSIKKNWFGKPGYYGEIQTDRDDMIVVNHKVDPLDVI